MHAPPLTRAPARAPFAQLALVLEREGEIVKEHLRDNRKDLALLVLRKKKYQQSLLDSANGQLLTLEQLVRIRRGGDTCKAVPSNRRAPRR